MKIVFSFIIFISIFGPKFGFFDTSLLGSLIGIIILSLLKKIKIPKDGFSLFIFLTIILSYSIIIFFVSETSNLYPVLRGTRALLATLLLGIVVYNFPLRISSMLNITIIIILINAIVIFIQILMPGIQVYFAKLYEFNKTIRNMRAFGLTAGFDTAGFLCVKGIVLSGVSFLVIKKSMKYILVLSIFSIATLFTSRSTMALSVFIVLGFALVFIIKSKFKYKLLGIITIVLIFLALFYYIIPIFSETFYLNIFDSFESDNPASEQFAKTNISTWINNRWILPENEYNLIFGSTVNPDSDVGYIILIHMIGIIGLILVVSFYFLMLSKVLKNSKTFLPFKGRCHLISIEKILLISLTIIICLEFVTNIKNLYFFTRSHYELTVILFFLALAGKERINLFMPKIYDK